MKYAIKLVKNPCGYAEGTYVGRVGTYSNTKFAFSSANMAYQQLELFWNYHKDTVKKDCDCIFEVEEYEET